MVTTARNYVCGCLNKKETGNRFNYIQNTCFTYHTIIYHTLTNYSTFALLTRVTYLYSPHTTP